MPLIHVRDHNENLVRVWTDEMRPYGQFTIMPLQDVENLRKAATKHDLAFYVIVHNCDGDDNCKCPKLSQNESIGSQL